MWVRWPSSVIGSGNSAQTLLCMTEYKGLLHRGNVFSPHSRKAQLLPSRDDGVAKVFKQDEEVRGLDGFFANLADHIVGIYAKRIVAYSVRVSVREISAEPVWTYLDRQARASCADSSRRTRRSVARPLHQFRIRSVREFVEMHDRSRTRCLS